MPRPLLSRGFAALFLLICAAAPLPAAGDGPAAPERPAEYMVYQYADTVLVIRVDLPETGFGVRILGPERAQLRAARLAGRRLGPVYLYVEPHDLPRQLMIEVTPERAVDRAAIGLELIQFTAGDRKDAALARAYRQYSIGVEAATSDDAATWAAKVYSLRDAALRFAELGREELRLWSEYFAAQLVLFELAEPVLAADLAREVRAGAGRAGLGQVDLAAQLLEADAEAAWLEGAAAPGPAEFRRAGERLAAAAAGAGAQGLHTEQARVLLRYGQLLERQGDAEGALAQYRRSLDALTGPGRSAYPDTELLNTARAAAAAAYERLGRTTGALAMLDEMDGAAPSDTDAARLEEAARLYEKGRLLNLAYRYAEAAPELRRARELQHGPGEAAAQALAGLELAWSNYALGRDDEAVELLREALPRVPAAEHGAAVARAWGSLASMYRAQEKWEDAARARASQRERLQAGDGAGLAEALFESALDAAARQGPHAAEVVDWLQQSRQAARANGEDLAAARVGLRLCRAQREAAECAGPALNALRQSAVPRLAAEAQYEYGLLLAQAGRAAEARRALEQALDEVRWYRRALPGVLGAWYRENVDALAAAYLALAAGDGMAPEESLLALERVRDLESGAPAGPPSPLDPGREDELRGLLAQREAAAGADAGRLAGDVDRALSAARRECGACAAGAPSLGELRRWLDALEPAEAVLAYYLGGARAWAVLAGRGETRRVDLGPAGRIRDDLQALQADLPGAELGADLAVVRGTLDELGRRLLAPLADDLPPRVYLLPAGALRALPLDLLRLDGAFLAARTGVVGLAGLTSLQRLRPALRADYRERVFLAGNPQTQRDPFRFELAAAPEVAAVTALFVGPGLHVVQGVALGRDEFDDPRYAEAALLHLALPGVADLGRPARSRLLLSEAVDAAGVQSLAPSDLRGFEVAADLAVLSGTALSGTGPAHAGRVPLVSDLLDAGAGAVTFSSWPAGEAALTAFARTFYGRLARDPDIVAAFLGSRAEALAGGPGSELGIGSGFQLFIR